MPRFEMTRRVPYTSRQMFDVVADVEKYPQFVPLCDGLRVKSRSSTGETTILVATMSIGYKGIHESFTTRVVLHPHTSPERIEVSYLDGPFQHLDNRWRFISRDGGGSDVHFFIDYEFRSMMLGLIMGSVFDKAFRKFAEAFEVRAREIYGPPGASRGAGSA